MKTNCSQSCLPFGPGKLYLLIGNIICTSTCCRLVWDNYNESSLQNLFAVHCRQPCHRLRKPNVFSPDAKPIMNVLCIQLSRYIIPANFGCGQSQLRMTKHFSHREWFPSLYALAESVQSIAWFVSKNDSSSTDSVRSEAR